MGCCDDCDNLGLAQGSSGGQGPPGPSGITTLLLGSQNIFVSKDGDDSDGTNRDLTKSYLTLTAAIIKASTLTPSSSNIINILVYPGTYTESISVPQYVNIIAVTPNELMYRRLPWTNISTSIINGLRPVYINGTITIVSNNVKVIGVNCNNISFNDTGANCFFAHIACSSSISTSVGSNISFFYDVHASSFFANITTLSSYLEKCVGGIGSFAGSTNGNAGNISGVLIDCFGANATFASSNFATGNGGNISGILINCAVQSTATNVFSSCSDGGVAGNITGTMIECDGGSRCFSAGGTSGTISGNLYRCRSLSSSSNYSFSSSPINGGTISGRLEDCYSFSTKSFSHGDVLGGTISGTLFGCTVNGSGFASSDSTGGTISGVLRNCYSIGATGISFAAGLLTGGTISGSIIDSTATQSSQPTFASGTNTGGNISGTLINCIGGIGSNFCSSGTTGGTITGLLQNCNSSGSGISFRKAVLSGKLISCRVNQTSTNEPAIIVGNGASVSRCDLKGNGSAFSIDSPLATSVSVVFTRTFGKGIGSNVTNLVGTPYNIDDTNDIY